MTGIKSVELLQLIEFLDSIENLISMDFINKQSLEVIEDNLNKERFDHMGLRGKSGEFNPVRTFNCNGKAGSFSSLSCNGCVMLDIDINEYTACRLNDMGFTAKGNKKREYLEKIYNNLDWLLDIIKKMKMEGE